MHKSFADWYQVAAIKPTSEMLAKRWAAVEAMAKWEKGSLLQDLVRLIRGTCPADASIRTTVTEAARGADNTFSARDNDAELRILAGATSVSILEAPSERADLVGLGLIASSFQETQGDQVAREFFAYARQYLSNEAVRVRASGQRPVVPDPIELKEKDPLGAFRTAMTNSPDHKQTAEPVVALVTAATAAVGTLLRDHAAHVYGELDALREESNMFWWVFSGYSRELSQPFSALGLPATCLVAAKELSDLTQLFPGPRAAPALLDRVLRDVVTEVATAKPRKGSSGEANTIRISDAVNAAPRDWRTKWIAACAPAAARELTPLLTAVQTSLATEDAKDWISAFTKSTTLADSSHAPATLAIQAYLESVFTRVVKTAKA
jgi:hypothetical protein